MSGFTDEWLFVFDGVPRARALKETKKAQRRGDGERLNYEVEVHPART